ncbi:hypothetical protein E2C01_073809 [Portunus trituberculatus]|uniref:Uncharacterized protein n=1 Tax=Portunus trituberculatus TaxID=210409 RepID=A0A5B7I1Q7_PORTR|nr:hypothetical protein [Portunus trituberculatus]
MADGEQVVKKEVVGEELHSMAELVCVGADPAGIDYRQAQSDYRQAGRDYCQAGIDYCQARKQTPVCDVEGDEGGVGGDGGRHANAQRPKPQEFDGRVSLEAYLVQFEVVARAQGCSEEERALNFVPSLKAPAVEVLSVNTCTTGVLHRRSERLGEALRTPVPGRGVLGEVPVPSLRTWRNVTTAGTRFGASDAEGVPTGIRRNHNTADA